MFPGIEMAGEYLDAQRVAELEEIMEREVALTAVRPSGNPV